MSYLRTSMRTHARTVKSRNIISSFMDGTKRTSFISTCLIWKSLWDKYFHISRLELWKKCQSRTHLNLYVKVDGESKSVYSRHFAFAPCPCWFSTSSCWSDNRPEHQKQQNPSRNGRVRPTNKPIQYIKVSRLFARGRLHFYYTKIRRKSRFGFDAAFSVIQYRYCLSFISFQSKITI